MGDNCNINYAIIVRADRKNKQYCRSIDLIYNEKKADTSIKPKSINDFVPGHLYYIDWKEDDGSSKFYKCQIVSCEVSKEDAWKNADVSKRTSRLKWVKKLTSSDSADCTQDENDKNKTVEKNFSKKKLKEISKNTRAESIKNKYKENEFLKNRTVLSDRVMNIDNCSLQMKDCSVRIERIPTSELQSRSPRRSRSREISLEHSVTENFENSNINIERALVQSNLSCSRSPSNINQSPPRSRSRSVSGIGSVSNGSRCLSRSKSRNDLVSIKNRSRSKSRCRSDRSNRSRSRSPSRRRSIKSNPSRSRSPSRRRSDRSNPSRSRSPSRRRSVQSTPSRSRSPSRRRSDRFNPSRSRSRSRIGSSRNRSRSSTSTSSNDSVTSRSSFLSRSRSRDSLVGIRTRSRSRSRPRLDRSESRSRSESFERQSVRSRSQSRSRPRPRAPPINVERWDEEIHHEVEYDVNFPYLHQFHPKLYYYYKENELLVPPEVPNLHPRYAEVDGKIYLGLRVFAKKDAWQATRMVKRFGIFCRNLAVILWGGEKLLANKSIYPSNKIINPDWGERTIISPQKLELYFSLVDDFINEKMPGTSETKRYDYLHGLTQRICRKIQDIRDALDPNKKKQKKQGKRRNQRK